MHRNVSQSTSFLVSHQQQRWHVLPEGHMCLKRYLTYTHEATAYPRKHTICQSFIKQMTADPLTSLRGFRLSTWSQGLPRSGLLTPGSQPRKNTHHCHHLIGGVLLSTLVSLALGPSGSWYILELSEGFL